MFGTIKPESTGLRLVGKYGRGSAVEVTGRDSLVVLTLGSEAAIVSFGRPDSPVVLSEIQFGSVTVQSRLCDSVLYVGGYGAVEAWNVSDPVNPEYLSRIPLGVSDFCVRDTFLYLMRQDTFRVFSVADPTAPRQLGWYRDSAVVFAVSGGTVVCGHPRQGVILVDVSDPTLPHRVGSVSGWALSAEVRGNLCCATFGNDNVPDELTLRVLDISDPSAPRQLGSISYCGGYDMCLGGQYLFLSGYYTGDYGFQVVDVSDSTHPRLVGECVTGGQGWGVWVDVEAQRGYVAGKYGGLIEIDISSPTNPTVIGSTLQADAAYDVAVNGSLAYVADYGAGLHILDLSDPSRPRQLGAYDTAGFLPGIQTCVVRGSFAFVNWYDGGGSRKYLRSVDVSDPSNPTFAGDAECLGPPVDMALEDTLLYVAEDYRFQVFNVARPREPTLTGSCGLAGRSGNMVSEGVYALVSNNPFSIVDVSDPVSPTVVGAYYTPIYGVDVIDTVAYAAGPYTGLLSLSVADPAVPYALDSLFMTDTLWWNDVVVVDTLAVVGGEVLWAVDVSSPRDLRLIPGVSWTPPYFVSRMLCCPPYLYAVCHNAGVCILEILPTGIAEPRRSGSPGHSLRVRPSMSSSYVHLYVSGLPGHVQGTIRDVVGRTIREFRVPTSGVESPAGIRVDLSDLPVGVYQVIVESGHHQVGARVVRTARR